MNECQTGSVRPQHPLRTQPFHTVVLPTGTVWTEFYRNEAGYLLRFPDLADFTVSANGRRVVVFPVPGTDPQTVEHLFVNQVKPLAFSRQGFPAFHAGVVTVPGGAAAFLGMTGLGKSTLTAAFASAGAAFLSDDGLLIQDVDGVFKGLPNHPSIRLWADSLENVSSRENNRASDVIYSPKVKLLASDDLPYCETPQPILAAYILDWQHVAGVTIRPLKGMDVVVGWLQHSFLLDVEDRDLVARHFDWMHRIGSAVPTFALDYPRKYERLPEVRAAVLEHVSGLGH